MLYSDFPLYLCAIIYVKVYIIPKLSVSNPGQILLLIVKLRTTSGSARMGDYRLERSGVVQAD
jgi:hypothetical protein